MAAGATLIGIAAFTNIKLAGYTVAGRQLARAYDRSRPRAFAFGAARTALGLTVGISYAFVTARLGLMRGEFLYYAQLLPIRLLEWGLMIWLFFGRAEPDRRRLFKLSFYGSLWSYALDVPAILAAFTVPGGMWIC